MASSADAPVDSSGDDWTIDPTDDQAITAMMSDSVRAIAGPLEAPVLRVLQAGGKRLRPALTLALAELLPPGRPASGRADAAIALATSVELLHCATLVHDDLIDAADTRRGVATISSVEGLSAAVVSGDLLIAAAALLAGGVSGRAGVVLAGTLGELCRGQALEEQLRRDADATPQQVIEVARLKTGSLIKAACRLGALAGGGLDAEPDGGADLDETVGQFGSHFGISLQLIDDVLDVVSSPGLSGKPVGADFAAGIMTLPTVFAIAAFPELAAAVGAGALGPAAPGPAASTAGPGGSAQWHALRRLRSPEAIEPSLCAAFEQARAAQAALLSLPGAGPGVEWLAEWPLRYLRSQLSTLVDSRWASLVSTFRQ